MDDTDEGDKDFNPPPGDVTESSTGIILSFKVRAIKNREKTAVITGYQ